MNDDLDKGIADALVVIGFIGTMAIGAFLFLVFGAGLVWEFPVLSFLWR